MKAEKPYPDIKAVRAAQAQLAHAHTDPLAAADYRKACRSPCSSKYMEDVATFTTSRCVRRAKRGFAQGQNAATVGYAAAVPFAALAAVAGLAPLGASVVVGGMGLELMQDIGKIKRTDRGVREDKVWTAVLRMRAALARTTNPEVKFALRTGELTLEELKAMCIEARACCQEARAASKRWTEGAPRPEFEAELTRLERMLDDLDKRFARWGEKLSKAAS